VNPDVGAIERSLSGRTPRYGALARVKNECDVIEAFVRHHAALLDGLVVVDNASGDGTREILDLLVCEGLPLVVVDDATLEFRQAEIMSYLARATFATFGFDRLFLLDADEFVFAADRAEIDRALAPFRDDESVRIPWATYVPSGEDEPGVSPLARIVDRRGTERVPEYKIVLPSSFASRVGATIAQGNHSITDGGTTVRTPVADLRLAHLPVRSPAQLLTKSLLAWTSYVAMGYDGEYGAQWKTLAATDGPTIASTIREIAFGYPGDPSEFEEDVLVREPVPNAAPLRYAHLAKPDPMQTVARFAEQIARRYASMRKVRGG